MDKGGFLGKSANKSKPEEETLTTAQNENFFDSKLFRLLTVVVYMLGLGGLGFTLAVYYIVLWDSTMPPVPSYKH